MYKIKHEHKIDNFSTYVTKGSTTFVNRELVIKLVPYTTNIKHVTKNIARIANAVQVTI